MATHKILYCPDCNARLYQSLHTQRTHAHCCHCCGWIGTRQTVRTFEYERERVSHFKLDYRIIDNILWKFYGANEFGFTFAQRCKRENCYEFEVSGELDGYSSEQVKHFYETGVSIQLSTSDVLNILCRDRWLEPGTYIIKVDSEVPAS